LTGFELRLLPAGVSLLAPAGLFERNNSMKLKELFDVLHEDITTSSPEEIKEACDLIIRTQAMDCGERDTLRNIFLNGPLVDSDMSSRVGRDALITDGFVTKVVLCGSDGYNACTYKGAAAYRLLKAEA